MENNKDASHRPELIFALVGPAGTRLDDLSTQLKVALGTFGYTSHDIRLSDLLQNYVGFRPLADQSEHARIRHLQDMGDAFRGALGNGAALALAGIAAIREHRSQITLSPDVPASGHAYILRQLKNPAEVDLLREVYGSSFVLVGGHAPRSTRIRELSRRMAVKENQPGKAPQFEAKAIEVIDVDQEHGGDLGQNTRDTYPRADFFANLAFTSGELEVDRFVDLLFGHPFHTPSPAEFAMYLASAVALRSSDSSRQVGAAVVSLTVDAATKRIINADVIASGMNEVPRGGGGFYWDGDSPDARDQWLKRYNDEDRATEIKTSALGELIEKLREKQWLADAAAASSANALARELLPTLRGTQFRDIGEFGRPVHAEMAALIDAARRGVSVNNHSMYVTTFPCHNCAKHIIAAGLREVVYLEPYPKSRAGFLHGEEILLDPEPSQGDLGKVIFRAFTGVAPRQYRQLFSMTERGGNKGLSLSEWEANRLVIAPRYVLRNASAAYLLSERQELQKLPLDVYKWDQRLVPAGPEEQNPARPIEDPIDVGS